MRKKILAILCAAAILVTLLAGCGGSGASMDAMAGGTMTGGTTTAPSAPGAAMKPGYGNSTNKSEAMYDSMEVPKEESGSTAGGDAVETTPQKLIYTATLEMETTAFEVRDGQGMPFPAGISFTSQYLDSEGQEALDWDKAVETVIYRTMITADAPPQSLTIESLFEADGQAQRTGINVN